MKISVFKDDALWFDSECQRGFNRIAIKPETRSTVEIKFSIDILDIQCYWSSVTRKPSNKIHWTIEVDSAGHKNFPFLSFFNMQNRNRATVALVGTVNDAKIVARMNQESCTYDISIKLASNGDSCELFLDLRDNIEWQESLAKWRELSAQSYPDRNIPADSWNPVYCTWYAVHASVTQDWVEEIAKHAVDLGFKTLIVDDGWCFDVMKRVSPATIGTWYELIGDWEVSKVKFPDFVNHVNRVKALGLNYLLWVTPFLIGNKSEIYKEIESKLFPNTKEGCRILDTKYAESSQIIFDKLSSLVKNYPIDGLKIDFLDEVTLSVSDPRGDETYKFVSDLSQAIRTEKSDALIEYRQYYATMQMLPNATQFRAMDVPFDFVDNFSNLCQIRLSMGDKVPVHADPMYWHPKESLENIGHHIIASLVGVPMLSMSLENMADGVKNVLKNYLALYQKYQATLNFGQWQIRYANTEVVYTAAKGDGESIIIVKDRGYLAEAVAKYAQNSKQVIILNLTGEALNVAGIISFDVEGNPSECGTISIAGYGILN